MFEVDMEVSEAYWS